MGSKIGQITKKSPDIMIHVTFVVEQQWQLQYYVNHVETGYIEDVQ